MAASRANSRSSYSLIYHLPDLIRLICGLTASSGTLQNWLLSGGDLDSLADPLWARHAIFPPQRTLRRKDCVAMRDPKERLRGRLGSIGASLLAP